MYLNILGARSKSLHCQPMTNCCEFGILVGADLLPSTRLRWTYYLNDLLVGFQNLQCDLCIRFRVKEHFRFIKNGEIEKSAVGAHVWKQKHAVDHKPVLLKQISNKQTRINKLGKYHCNKII